MSVEISSSVREAMKTAESCFPSVGVGVIMIMITMTMISCSCSVYVGAATVNIRICYTYSTYCTVYTDKIPNNTVTIQYKAVDAFGILS